MKSYKSEPHADLEFQFPDDLCWDELDKQNVKLPHKMSLADFFIERERDILLVEVKDPSNVLTPQAEREKYFKRLEDNSIVTEELTPKARNSYTYLHLMNRDDKPFKYIVLLGLDSYDGTKQQALLLNFKDKLLFSICNESYEPWKRKHIVDCAIMSVDSWNQFFPDCPVRRISGTATTP